MKITLKTNWIVQINFKITKMNLVVNKLNAQILIGNGRKNHIKEVNFILCRSYSRD